MFECEERGLFGARNVSYERRRSVRRGFGSLNADPRATSPRITHDSRSMASARLSGSAGSYRQTRSNALSLVQMRKTCRAKRLPPVRRGGAELNQVVDGPWRPAEESGLAWCRMRRRRAPDQRGEVCRLVRHRLRRDAGCGPRAAPGSGAAQLSCPASAPASNGVQVSCPAWSRRTWDGAAACDPASAAEAVAASPGSAQAPCCWP